MAHSATDKTEHLNPTSAGVSERNPTATLPPGHVAAAPRQAAAPDFILNCLGAYTLVRELGRGGMGQVYLGRDQRLGRDVAIKVLHERYRGNGSVKARFLEEAQITGQLQNPGVPPIHELGELEDGRPYLVMKLVKGNTLAADLAEWHEQKLPRREIVARTLPIVEKVVQTMAYAHSKAVLHRDLKPANIMVGAFGEVQVMDWGLAKVLTASGSVPAPPVAEPNPGATRIGTDRADDSETQAGDVLGTPAYMSPEQARGEVNRLSTRSDVFALGCLLCEILTGRPPYQGALVEIRAKAELGLVEEAFAQLDQCGADPELVSIAKRCLARDPGDRPADAGELAQMLSNHRAGVAQRLHQAELDRAAAAARSAERRKKRQVQTALFLTLLVLLAMVLAGWRWWQLQEQALVKQQAERESALDQDAAMALKEAGTLLHQAGTLADDPQRWEDTLARAEAAVQRAESAATQLHGSHPRHQEIAELRQRYQAAQRDRVLVNRLDELAFRTLDSDELWESSASKAAEIAAALRENGMPLDAEKAAPEEAARWVKNHAHRYAVLEALFDLWNHEPRPEPKDRTLAILRRAMNETGPLTAAWMRAVEQRDGQALAALAAKIPDQDLSPWLVHRLFLHLWTMGHGDEGLRLLKRGIARFPADYRLRSRFGQSLIYLNTLQTDHQAARELSAAAALRPDSFNVFCCLARLHQRTGDREAAEACLKRAKELLARIPAEQARPGASIHLAFTLRGFGDHAGALALLQQAVRVHPNHSSLHDQLAWTKMQTGDYQGAHLDACRAVALEPTAAGRYNTLAGTCGCLRKFKEAEAAYRKAMELDPNLAYPYGNLAGLLSEQERWEEALPLFEKSLELYPYDWSITRKYVRALTRLKRLPQAAEVLRKANEKRPDDALFAAEWGRILLRQANYIGAEQELRKTLAAYPNNAEAHNLLSIAVGYQGRIDEAISLLRRAIVLDPNHAHAHMNLGGWLIWKGELKEAGERIAKARQLNPNVKSDVQDVRQAKPKQ